MEVKTKIDESHRVLLDSMEYKNQMFTTMLQQQFSGALTVELIDLKTLNLYDEHHQLRGYCKVRPMTLCKAHTDGTKSFEWYFRPDDTRAPDALKEFPEDLRVFAEISGGTITDPMVLSVLYANLCETYPFKAVYTVCLDHTADPKEYISLGIKKIKWVEGLEPNDSNQDDSNHQL